MKYVFFTLRTVCIAVKKIDFNARSGKPPARARCAVQGTIPSPSQIPIDCWLLRDSALISIQPLLGIGVLMILGNFGPLELLPVDAAPYLYNTK